MCLLVESIGFSHFTQIITNSSATALVVSFPSDLSFFTEKLKENVDYFTLVIPIVIIVRSYMVVYLKRMFG